MSWKQSGTIFFSLLILAGCAFAVHGLSRRWVLKQQAGPALSAVTEQDELDDYCRGRKRLANAWICGGGLLAVFGCIGLWVSRRFSEEGNGAQGPTGS